MPEIAARPTETARPEQQPEFSDEALFLTDAPVPGPARRATRAAVPFSARSVSDWTELEAIAESWQDLAAAAAEPNPFYEPWMLLPALRSFARNGRVEVVLVFRGDDLCGLFPVAYRRGRAELWRHPYCYLTAPLLRRGCERVAIRSWLDAIAGRAGLIRIEDMPAAGRLRCHLVDELNDRRWPALVTQAYTRAVLQRAETPEEFLTRALARKRRREFRRQRARLS